MVDLATNRLFYRFYKVSDPFYKLLFWFVKANKLIVSSVLRLYTFTKKFRILCHGLWTRVTKNWTRPLDFWTRKS